MSNISSLLALPGAKLSDITEQYTNETTDCADSKPIAMCNTSGLLALPGELRNKMYEELNNYSDDDRRLYTALALSSCCRRLRSEYLPLFHRVVTIVLPLRSFVRFLETYFSSMNPETPRAFGVCKFSVRLRISTYTTGIRMTTPDGLQDPQPLHPINLKWLAAFVRSHSSNEIKFYAQNNQHAEEIMKLKELVHRIKSKDAWRHGLAGFESIELVPGWNLKWKVDVVLKIESAGVWWTGGNFQQSRIASTLNALGLLEPEGRGGKTRHRLRDLQIRVYWRLQNRDGSVERRLAIAKDAR